MKNTGAFILPLVLLTLMGLLLYSTLVWYQAYYAYYSALEQYHAYQQEYALKGLYNQAVDACIVRVRTHGHFSQPYNYSVPEWAVLTNNAEQASVTVEPQPGRYYKITAAIGSANKTGIIAI